MQQSPDPAESRRRVLADHEKIIALTARLAAVGGADEMVSCLRQLATILTGHFKEEEDGFDGLHDDIRKRTPEQQHALMGLKEEHTHLLERVQLLLSIAQQSRGPAPKLQVLGKQLQDRLSEHEARETQVFLDSIWTDLGESD